MRHYSIHGITGLADELMRCVSEKCFSAFFITGTDTGVGKTLLTVALLRECRRRDMRVAGFKPICCGDRADARALWKHSERGIPLDVINPIHLRRPLAPVSQISPPWTVALRRVRRAFSQFSAWNFRLVLVEGAGGLLCPIDHKHTMRDLARGLKLPVVIVARNQLGVLNHTLLTAEAAAAAELECAAIVLNSFGKAPDRSCVTNAAALKRLTRIPIFTL